MEPTAQRAISPVGPAIAFDERMGGAGGAILSFRNSIVLTLPAAASSTLRHL
jgi:hypothetical protein